MRRNNIIYWVTTSLFALMMLFSGVSYFFSPEAVSGFAQLGFPDFFRIELGSAKILGALALLIPHPYRWIRDFAYSGFAIVLISAFIAHVASGDGAMSLAPLVVLGILATSYIYSHKRVA